MYIIYINPLNMAFKEDIEETHKGFKSVSKSIGLRLNR